MHNPLPAYVIGHALRMLFLGACLLLLTMHAAHTAGIVPGS